MRVTLCVDALQPRLSGIGRYTWELCKGLRQHREISELNFFRAGVLIDRPERLLNDTHYRPKRRRLLRWAYALRARRTVNSTLVHGPNYFLPRHASTGVITVHDLSIFRYPETHPAERVKSFERQFASSLNRAARIITDTETVRQELIEEFSLDPDLVSAVSLGVDRKFRLRAQEEVAPSIGQWGLQAGGYGLSVAAFEPRKKIGELIRAWGCLPDADRRAFPLVLAGPIGWRNQELMERVHAGKAEGWLKYLGFVDEALLPDLYSGARLFVYPSIYEGFGLPPVEAMASGTPVIVSNRSCLPEVCGDAARYVDPDDLEAFASAIEECLTDEHWQLNARQRGLERARLFSWADCVRETIGVYAKAGIC